MPYYRAPLDEIEFSLRNVIGYEAHLASMLGDDSKLSDLHDIFDQSAKFAEEILLPLNASGDEVGAQLNADGNVVTPPGFREAYRQFIEGGWQGLAQPETYGGQGLPESLWFIVNEYWQATNHSWCMYIGTTEGACATLRAHADQRTQAVFLPKLVSGEWPGTMCLTEAHCGSDLGLLRTCAEPVGDGTYAITGEKVFISSGDHDLAENIVHLVLARLPDAPAGSAGISLFLVPKYTVSAAGEISARNGCSVSRIESKMGLRGNATCVLHFDQARGILIGPANKGLRCMFTFINNSRLGVAVQALAHIDGAYQIAAEYAQSRIQGAVQGQTEAVAIAEHPDVKRMLARQKAIATFGRVFLHFLAIQVDLQHSDDAATSQRADALLALLTPIAKGCLSEWSGECTNLAMQVLGGHGYVKDHGIEQHIRDARVTQIYEGTTGIQALDLLERKIFGSQCGLIDTFIAAIVPRLEAQTTGDFSRRVMNTVRAELNAWQALSRTLLERNAGAVGSCRPLAYDYLMYTGWVVLACYAAMFAGAAEQEILEHDVTDKLSIKLEVSEYFFDYLFAHRLPHQSILVNSI